MDFIRLMFISSGLIILLVCVFLLESKRTKDKKDKLREEELIEEALSDQENSSEGSKNVNLLLLKTLMGIEKELAGIHFWMIIIGLPVLIAFVSGIIYFMFAFLAVSFG